jgi:predicted dehydrogenase
VRGAVVRALADSDPGRLRSLASALPGVATYSDYDALIADPSVDLVAVCVPVTLHAAVARAALRAGKHAFVEKPLALTTDDCDRLVDEARHGEVRGVRSAVGFNLRSHRLVQEARRLVQSGRLGNIELLRTVWTADWTGRNRPEWHSTREQGGGALLEIGSHLVDLWRFLLDSEVEVVHALSTSAAFDDQTVVLEARMRSGVLVSASTSQASASHNVIELFGNCGSLRFSCYHADSLEVWPAAAPTRGAWRRIRPLLERAARLPAAFQSARSGGDFVASYTRQWERIVEGIRTGDPFPASFEDGRQSLRVLRAALHSIEVGSPAPAAGEVSDLDDDRVCR